MLTRRGVKPFVNQLCTIPLVNGVTYQDTLVTVALSVAVHETVVHRIALDQRGK